MSTTERVTVMVTLEPNIARGEVTERIRRALTHVTGIESVTFEEVAK